MPTLLSSLDFCLAVAARANRSASGDERSVGLFAVALMFFAALTGVGPTLRLDRTQTCLLLAPAMLMAITYAWARRRAVDLLLEGMPIVLAHRTRLAMFACLMSGIVSAALLAPSGWWQPLAALVAVCLLPWARWGGVGAP